MKYMMLMNTPPGPAGEFQINNWAPEDFKAHMRFMMDFNRGIKATGEFVEANGLTAPSQAKLVRAGANGEPITDGPFAETKEFLVGFWILDVESPERAYELAARVSTAPGPGGKPMNMSIELRPLHEGPLPDV